MEDDADPIPNLYIVYDLAHKAVLSTGEFERGFCLTVAIIQHQTPSDIATEERLASEREKTQSCLEETHSLILETQRPIGR